MKDQELDKLLEHGEEIYVSRETAKDMGLLDETKRVELLNKNIIISGVIPKSKFASINVLQEFERCRELERELEEEEKRDSIKEVMENEPRRWLVEGNDDDFGWMNYDED